MFLQYLISFIISIPIIFAQTTNQLDLLNLFEHEKIAHPDIIKPYQIISVQQSWQKIKDVNPLLKNVNVGVIDTGVDSGHQEFNNPKVDFGNSPADALNDDPAIRPSGHGTQVAGIIGANNVLGSGGTLSPASPQMNGILSGALPTNLYGLEMRRFESFIKTDRNKIGFEKVTTIGKLNQVLGGMKTDITNLSIGLLKCSTFLGLNLPPLFGGCVKDENFNDVTNFFKEGFNSQPDTLFVISAGNEDADSTNSTPANIMLNNTIIIGATGLKNERADFKTIGKIGESNFGSGVDISAPGIGIYAPAVRGKGNFPQEGGDYEFGFSGTSAAAPMVTGVAGLIKAIKPALTPAQIKQILISNADPIQTDKPIGGRLNALKAVCDPLVLNCAPTPPPQPSNTWQPVGPMTTERADHTATLLNDGRVLIAGGFKGNGPTFTVLNSAEIFNPATNSFTSVSNMTTPRTFHTATLLLDGRVLIAGGNSDVAGTNLNSAEIFNPIANTFSSVGNLNSKRFYHTANLLSDGRVLIAGGFDSLNLKSTEIFDPNTSIFTPGHDMNMPRAHHASTRLNDGRILLVNGLIIGSIMSVDIYNPVSNIFTSATSSAEQLGLSVSTLQSGKALIFGGKLFSQPNGQAAEIFNPADNSFTEVGPMLIFGIARDSLVLLSSGQVLFVGASIKAQIFNPQTNEFKLTGDLNIPRFTRHRLVSLQDGQALVTGGQLSETQFITTNGAEVFRP